jgi:ATP-dependent DNA helicase RecQ
MELAPEVTRTLHECFGFSSFRPGQEAVVRSLLEGHSALAVFPTGAGKSLCYQLPALLLPGMTLVVSPLIALMKDQIDFLVSKGVRAARLDSSLTGEEARTVWDDLWEGRLKLLYVAPERFASERFLDRIRRTSLSLMVIDEAHCISEWGHNFRPDYMKLAAVARDLRVERVLALTATATPSVAEDICASFSIAPEDYVNTGFHRPNLTMRSSFCGLADRDRLLKERLLERPRGPSIVYVTLQKTAETVASRLAECGLPTRAYHAGMDGEERHRIQDWFMASSDGVVVATIAFGMGIDKADIRYVYHYNMPKSLENYMQETGRAGRDGLPSCCDLLVCPDDVATLENFTYGDTPTRASVQGVVEEVLAQPETFDLSLYDLSTTHDLRMLVLKTLLTYLELDGILVSTGPLYNEYRFQPQRPSKEILADHDREEAHFLRRLLARSKKGRTWFSLDIKAASEALGEPRRKLVAALNRLEERGDMILKVAKVRQGYRFQHRPEFAGPIAESITQRFQNSETRCIARIEQVVELAASPDCTVRQVLGYFGEDLGEDCGHCDRCLGEPRPPVPPRVEREVSPQEILAIEQLVAEQHAALRTPRQLARYLCGLSSPATSRARLTRDSRFGSLAHHRFACLVEVGEELPGGRSPG